MRKIFRKIVFIFPIFYVLCSMFSVLCFWFLSEANAANMSSDNYELQMGNFNMASGNKSSAGYKLLDTLGQTAPGKYESTGYIVKAGFAYIKSIIPFSFTISDLTIDFGSLTAQTPSTQTNTLTVSAGGAGGYQVTAFENHPLQVIGGAAQIPDTTCNGNGNTCDETTAKIWDDNTKYGFGFNMSGDDVPSDFVDSTYYRQFADDSAGETAQIVMSSNNVGSNRQATVTYKVNISGVQAAGNYENVITFICTPGY